jgi:hypothetical protein
VRTRRDTLKHGHRTIHQGRSGRIELRPGIFILCKFILAFLEKERKQELNVLPPFDDKAQSQGVSGFGKNNQANGNMRKLIEDEFTHLPLSRQRKYQLRRQREGRCTECGDPAAQGSRCLRHLVKARERQRKQRGLKRRYHGTLSYRLQKETTNARSKRMRVSSVAAA